MKMRSPGRSISAHRSCTASAKPWVFVQPQEISVSGGLRGGAGRTRTGNQTVISPGRQSSESGAHEHGIEDGRRKDWHFAANRAVVSSSWGSCLSGILPRVWLPVRVLPAPPRSPVLTPNSPSPRNTLDFPRFGAGVMGVIFQIHRARMA